MPKEKPLTLSQLAKYTKDVLLPATQKQFIDYTTEVLLPAIGFTMDKKIGNLKNELLSENKNLKNELLSENRKLEKRLEFKIDKKFEDMKDELLTKDDEIIAKLDKIDTENTIRNGQEDREKKFHKIVVNHLETGSTSAEELSEIKELNVL